MDADANEEVVVDGVAYIDRLVREADDDVTQDDDGSELTDNSGEFPFGEDPESDDDFDYDSEEEVAQIHIKVKDPISEIVQEAWAACTQRNNQSRAPAPRTWRLDKDESFSDWTIEVTVEDGGADSQHLYHVHRTHLAVGTQKSGYFEALFRSQQFNECSDNMSRLVLPEAQAASFPDFLDFLYSHPTECKSFINYENCLSLDYLADYFDVPTLSEAIEEFIKEDMQDLSHLEKYLLQYCDTEGCRFDFVPYTTVTICAENILSIKADSSLLSTLSPAMLLKVITLVRSSENIRGLTSEDQHHICRLGIGYIRKYQDQLDDSYFCAFASQLYFPEDLELSHKVALDLLEIMKDSGWQSESYHSPCYGAKADCIAALSLYLADMNDPSIDKIKSMAERIPAGAMTVLLAESLRASKAKEPKVITVSCKIMDSRLGKPVGTMVEVRVKTTVSMNVARYLLGRQLDVSSRWANEINFFRPGASRWAPTIVKSLYHLVSDHSISSNVVLDIYAD